MGALRNAQHCTEVLALKSHGFHYRVGELLLMSSTGLTCSQRCGRMEPSGKPFQLNTINTSLNRDDNLSHLINDLQRSEKQFDKVL